MTRETPVYEIGQIIYEVTTQLGLPAECRLCGGTRYSEKDIVIEHTVCGFYYQGDKLRYVVDDDDGGRPYTLNRPAFIFNTAEEAEEFRQKRYRNGRNDQVQP